MRFGMPYCRKCGAKLDDTARFCHVCGTPVAPVDATTRPAAPRKRSPMYLLPVIVLIAVLITAAIIAGILFLPVNAVNTNETRQLYSEAGVDHLVLYFQADVAQVNVYFENLHDKMMLLNVTASGWTGLLGDPNDSVTVTFSSETINDTATATSRVSRANMWPMQFALNVVCDVHIDPSATLNLIISSDVGQITMDADKHVTFEELNLETTTGGVDVSLAKNVVVAGPISLKSNTGTVQFRMNEADISSDVTVDVRSSTGFVDVDLAATQSLSGNVTVNARTTTGAVNLFMVIDNGVGGRIESETDVGKITVDVKSFSGNQTPLQSNNYPAENNFFVNLRTTTGGININADYGSSTVLN
jgi:hypothetical protein